MPIVNSSQRRSLVPRPIAKAWPPQVPLMKSSLQDTATRSSRNLERASGSSRRVVGAPGIELVQLRRVHRDVCPFALRASDERGKVRLGDE